MIIRTVRWVCEQFRFETGSVLQDRPSSWITFSLCFMCIYFLFHALRDFLFVVFHRFVAHEQMNSSSDSLLSQAVQSSVDLQRRSSEPLMVLSRRSISWPSVQTGVWLTHKPVLVCWYMRTYQALSVSREVCDTTSWCQTCCLSQDAGQLLLASVCWKHPSYVPTSAAANMFWTERLTEGRRAAVLLCWQSTGLPSAMCSLNVSAALRAESSF